MRRIAESNAGCFPQHLVVFDGRELAATGTEAEYQAAFDVWCSAREEWHEAHPGVMLPSTELGGQVIEGEPLFHSGPWRQPADGGPWRCDEHGRTPGEH